MFDYMPAGPWQEDLQEPVADEVANADTVFETSANICSEIRLYLASRMQRLRPGQVLELISGDPDARTEVPNWCALRGYTLLRVHDDEQGKRHYFIRKPAGSPSTGP